DREDPRRLAVHEDRGDLSRRTRPEKANPVKANPVKARPGKVRPRRYCAISARGDQEAQGCMEPFALTLLLVAAISHAVWNAIAKSATGNPYVFVWAYLVLASALLLPITAVFLYQNGWPESAGMALAPVISGVLHVVYL